MIEMEYGQAFSYIRQDPDWLKKWGLAGLISIVPVLGPIMVAGYGVEVTRRVIREEERPLPPWSDLAGFAIQGLIAVVIGLAYTLPLILLIACAGLLPLGLNLAGAEANREVASALETLSSAVALCCSCLATAYGLFAALTLTAALGRYAATDRIGAAFQINEVVRLVRVKPGMFFVVALLSMLTALAFSLLGSLACGIGAFFGAAYATLVAAHLQGQAYRYVTQTHE
ncbi:MAG: DUF4013 domain-containing protein [Anaerolineales bacterium]|nr:DUF4013 domain-containing protein [Anaerolineales bacterium]